MNNIKHKVTNNLPLTFEELMLLYDSDLDTLQKLAEEKRRILNGNKVFYNQNFHIEPSNVCIHRCRFCSYRRNHEYEQSAWSMSIDDIRKYCYDKYEKGMTEVHIVGGIHPDRDFEYYETIIGLVRSILPPKVAIKAYSAIEIDDMCIKSELSAKEILIRLKKKGLSALPGGGAEIFDSEIREKICPDKASAKRWLEIHGIAHRLGISTNATMLFGHIENREQRVRHILKIRSQQEITKGFNAFIPLKFSSVNNDLSYLEEIKEEEVLRTFAIVRLALHNIPHIKAYWPMLGKELCIKTLLFGADDIDGTINNSTKIYSMAGAQEQRPALCADELKKMAQTVGFDAKERDSFYNII